MAAGLPPLVIIANRRRPGIIFTQEFETLASKIGYLGRQASDVAARSRQTSDEVVADRIRHRCEYDRNDRRRRLRCDDVYGSVRNNDVHLKSNKFGDDLG